jgi:hypothetical protein
VENAGVDQASAEIATSEPPEWAGLVRLAGGIHGKHL